MFLVKVESFHSYFKVWAASYESCLAERCKVTLTIDVSVNAAELMSLC